MAEVPHGIKLAIPGSEPMHIRQLVLNFIGTLSCDGILLPGGAELLPISRNHLPSAGGSLFHPHPQVQADRIPANFQPVPRLSLTR